MSETTFNRRLTLWLGPDWAGSELVGFPASSHPAIRDVAKTYVLQGAEPAPGAERWRFSGPGGRVDWEEKQPIDNTQILLETGDFLKLWK